MSVTTTTTLIVKASQLPWYTILARAGVVKSALYLSSNKIMKTKRETARAEILKPITDAMDIQRKTKKETVAYFTNLSFGMTEPFFLIM
jgi:hypothetical protein